MKRNALGRGLDSLISIDSMEVGISDGSDEKRIHTDAFELEGWGNTVTYHERPKASYYILKDYWNAG